MKYDAREGTSTTKYLRRQAAGDSASSSPKTRRRPSCSSSLLEDVHAHVDARAHAHAVTPCKNLAAHHGLTMVLQA